MTQILHALHAFMFHGPEFNHMVTSGCRGEWEMYVLAECVTIWPNRWEELFCFVLFFSLSGSLEWSVFPFSFDSPSGSGSS